MGLNIPQNCAFEWNHKCVGHGQGLTTNQFSYGDPSQEANAAEKFGTSVYASGQVPEYSSYLMPTPSINSEVKYWETMSTPMSVKSVGASKRKRNARSDDDLHASLESPLNSQCLAPDSAGLTTNTTTASFHSYYSSIITHVESRRIVVNETPERASDGPEINEGSKIEEIESLEDIPEDDDNSQFEKIEGTEDISANDDNSQIEKIEGTEDIPANDDNGQIEKMEGTEDIPANDDNGQIDKIEGAGDIPANDDDSPIHRAYQFDNCHVYINSFNARGIEVKNSGNYAPRVSRLSCSLLQFSLSTTDPYC